MKAICWIGWLLTICVCLAEARYKVRRPMAPAPPPPPQMYKKSWPIGHRMSMGNTIHINSNNFPSKRPVFNKHHNFRGRRPPVFNAPATTWKNPIPMLGGMTNLAVLPQRAPIKEFHLMNKVPEYSPEYRPEPIIMPPTHRGGIDDDKGPIHTIPAPNLSLADKPYNPTDDNSHDNAQGDYRRYHTETEYNANPVSFERNYGFGPSITSTSQQRPVTNPTPAQNSYEVSETNDINQKDYQTPSPTYFNQDFDSSRLPTASGDSQNNDLYLNHPPISRIGVMSSNIQFPRSNVPMQTNLHSSLHVGFPSSAPSSSINQPQEIHHNDQQSSDIHIGQQAPDLHVGHPAPAGPPLSATQLYDLLNSFPQQLTEQYTTGQQPQLQQHILQQQLGQLFQPEANPTSFSQPQLHSFNYDEQANKQMQQQQQQQQVLVGQNYGSGRVTADYNLQPEEQLDIRNNGGNLINDEIRYQGESSEQPDNNIDYDGVATSGHQIQQNGFYNNDDNDGSMSTNFYTTLPNRDAAEKLAALAAAGNVNSHLIGQLRKQQQQQQQEDNEQQSDQPMPLNHKIEYQVHEQVEDEPIEEGNKSQRGRKRYGIQKQYHRQQYRQQQNEQEQAETDELYEQQRVQQEQKEEEIREDKRPLRIMVPEIQEESQRISTNTGKTSEDYDYENSEHEGSKSTASSEDASNEKSNSEFGERLSSKNGK